MYERGPESEIQSGWPHVKRDAGYKYYILKWTVLIFNFEGIRQKKRIRFIKILKIRLLNNNYAVTTNVI